MFLDEDEEGDAAGEPKMSPEEIAAKTEAALTVQRLQRGRVARADAKRRREVLFVLQQSKLYPLFAVCLPTFASAKKNVHVIVSAQDHRRTLAVRTIRDL